MAKKDHVPLVTLDQIETKELQWLVPGIMPMGCVTALSGGPESGKSSFVAALMAHLTGGEPLLANLDRRSCNCSWVAREESMEAIIKPRLISHGTNVSRVSAPFADARGRIPQSFRFPSSLDALDTFIKNHGIKLMFFDPIRSFLDGGFDSNSDNDVRGMVESLIYIAENRGMSFVMTCHHRKSKQGSSVDWMAGSAAWGQTVRVVIQFAPHSDGVRNVMSFAKFSIGDRPPSRWFCFEKRIGGYVFKLGEQCSVLSADAASSPQDSSGRMEMSAGAAWLKEHLEANPQEVGSTYKLWQAQGFSRRGWWDARRMLDVQVSKQGVSGSGQQTFLSLPESEESCT